MFGNGTNRGVLSYFMKAAKLPWLYSSNTAAAKRPVKGRAAENEELWMATAAHMLTPLPQLSPGVAQWVESVRELTQPRAIHWCDGSEAEQRELTAKLLRDGELKALNPEFFPGCHLARSNPSDVARVEHLTYICSRSKDDAGPNNN